MNNRKEFSAKSKLEGFERCNGYCEGDNCGIKLRKWHADHRIPCAMGGDNSIDNLQCLCEQCHSTKTSEKDLPAIAKTKRIRRRAAGIRKRRTMRAWRRFDGSIVHADD